MNEMHKKRLKNIPLAINYLLVVGVVFLISFLFPNNARFKYDFESGQNWNYTDLVAPFDFAIQKSSTELASEYEKIERSLSPYYQVNTDLQDERLVDFGKKFNEQLESVKSTDQFSDVQRNPAKYLEFGKNYLSDLYEEPIIELDSTHIDQPKSFVINILEGNSIYSETIDNIENRASALEQLTDELPYVSLAESDFLFPLLVQQVQPNLFYNKEKTEKYKNEELSKIPKVQGIVNKGEIIVKQGGLIDRITYQKLISFRDRYQQDIAMDKSHWGIFAGYFILTSLIIGALLLYLVTYCQPIFRKFNKLAFILLWVVLYSYLVYLVEQSVTLNVYMIPFAIVPIVIKTFFNERLALFTHIVIVLISSFLSSQGYEFTFLQILIGIVVLLADVNTRDLSKFFYSMFFIFMTFALGHIGLSLIESGDIWEVEALPFSWYFVHVFLTLLAYPLIPLLERLFGFTSSITLLELSDMNKPLLRELSLKAPGTLQHSLQVANLSEAAAQKIGADSLLVKVGALYHDIGKTKQPTYFIENQSGENPHDQLNHLESAQIIFGHVTAGVEMAKKQRLPSILIQFIKSHHGTTRVEYFYRNYLKDNPEEEVDESLFRYVGPLPTTKEETILMMADSIEAACKSLKDPTDEQLTGLIDKIIAGKLANQQFVESELTFQELATCVDVFKQIMRSVHHVRIAYPDEKKPKQTSTKSSEG